MDKRLRELAWELVNASEIFERTLSQWNTLARTQLFTATKAMKEALSSMSEPPAHVTFDKPVIGSDGVVQTGWQSAAPSEPQASEPQFERLMGALKLARTRLEICRDRFAGCYAPNEVRHPISLEEIPAWMKDIDDILSRSSDLQKQRPHCNEHGIYYGDWCPVCGIRANESIHNSEPQASEPRTYKGDLHKDLL